MLKKITDIITAQLGCDAELINEDSALFEDLGADSLDLVEILMAVEENFGVSIPDEEMPEFRTIADIMAYIDNTSEGTNEE
ncbi:MAG: acyl carrier protein [Clostridia bacterium]|nr:acyl carrier protein [Clostridia bacterium]